MAYRNALAEIRAELLAELGKVATAKVQRGKMLPAVPGRDEMQALLAAPDNGRDRLIIRLFYATGVRVAELAALSYGDLTPGEGTIFVRKGKEHKERLVCADPETFERLLAWQKMARDGKPATGEIFGLTTRQLERVVTHWGNQVGLVKKYRDMQRSFSPHAIRHAFATHSYERGMDLYALKKLLGHQFLETTEIYVQVAMAHTRHVYLKTGPFCQTS